MLFYTDLLPDAYLQFAIHLPNAYLFFLLIDTSRYSFA